ncbi:hypothetical protein GBA52_012177 [Prunus armeniaca]|nr:hypothetical protein GBA52_012177 [Prunus armeniaca]
MEKPSDDGKAGDLSARTQSFCSSSLPWFVRESNVAAILKEEKREGAKTEEAYARQEDNVSQEKHRHVSITCKGCGNIESK